MTLLCALTGDRTYSLAVLGQRSNPLSSPAGAQGHFDRTNDEGPCALDQMSQWLFWMRPYVCRFQGDLSPEFKGTGHVTSVFPPISPPAPSLAHVRSGVRWCGGVRDTLGRGEEKTPPEASRAEAAPSGQRRSRTLSEFCK